MTRMQQFPQIYPHSVRTAYAKGPFKTKLMNLGVGCPTHKTISAFASTKPIPSRQCTHMDKRCMRAGGIHPGQ
jgi:hypothetical protein